ncbi:MAG TPA: SH3 domain-containing protein [Caulobacteraceae bacterium]|jgi:curli biogenesis system outer membrane secretion channel CsgG|nr:SH3 domain-containing protein [Caulobacteraceae bacterium]
MKNLVLAASALAAVASLAFAGPASAQYGMDRGQPKNMTTPNLPQCAHPIGTAAIKEPDHDWWSPLGLSNPESLLKLFASRSGCLRIVQGDTGVAMHSQQEDLASSGELQRNSNVGKGQVAAADFFIIPDIANQNSNSSGSNVGAALGHFLPGAFGAIAGSISTKSEEAQTLITLVNARTTEQLYVAEGAAKKTDISFGAGGGVAGWAGFIAAAGGGYSNTNIGQVISAAYFNAYVDLVHYMQTQGMDAQASAQNAPQQAYHVTRSFVMRASPSADSRRVRDLAVGDEVFPTGQQNGVWWQVDDENGNRGWVSSTAITAH